MILSFHPIIEADRNIICAGRAPDENDLNAIRQATAVILPQGCSEALYRLARTNCERIFPNLDVRFDHPGKRGQISLFRRLGIACPQTRCYASVADFQTDPALVGYPVVVKLDWGGQGETVFKATDRGELDRALQRAAAFESSGQPGFLIQQYVPSDGRSLRVVVIGSQTVSYWRCQPVPGRFGTSVEGGARIDHHSDPDLQRAARLVVRDFCRRTGLQLGGFDFMFNSRARIAEQPVPLMLEINYFFGRTGLGGSQVYYEMLAGEVDRWLGGLGLCRKP